MKTKESGPVNCVHTLCCTNQSKQTLKYILIIKEAIDYQITISAINLIMHLHNEKTGNFSTEQFYHFVRQSCKKYCNKFSMHLIFIIRRFKSLEIKSER